jgi:hypothetical protein
MIKKKYHNHASSSSSPGNPFSIETMLATHTSSFQNTYGEFFTPLVLIDELLKEIPESVWTDPFVKWFDPCAGRGNFFMVVFYRLMDKLNRNIPDEDKRSTHILRNMLYMNELNPVNIIQLKKMFGKEANISCEDFLKMDASNSPKFDVILQNPPYQVPKKKSYSGTRGSNFSLWDKFVVHSFTFLKENGGYIGCITPANWRRTEHRLYDTITPHLKYLSIYNKKDGLELFGAQTRFDVYLMHVENNVGKRRMKKATIHDDMGKIHHIDPLKWRFLPNSNYEMIKKHFSYDLQRDILYDTNEYNSASLSVRKTKRNKYPVVHTMTRKGMGIRYSAKKRGHFHIPKVILNVNEKLYPYNDWKGEYGMSQLSFGIPIKSKTEGTKWIKTLNSKEIQDIVKATKWGSFQTDYRMFQYLVEK